MDLSQVVLFGLVLPEPEKLMEPWLLRVDKALEDDELVDAVMVVLRRRWRQSIRRGRAGTPAEVALRMLAHKHLRDWSYDELEREVSGSLVYRRFCRIDATKVPDAKTMVRLGQLVDGPVLRQLLQRLVTMAATAGVTRGRKMRVDITVVEAGVHLGFKVRNVRRSVSRRMREIAQGLRRRGDRAKRAIRRPYRRLLLITGRLVRQAQRAAEQARQQHYAMRGHRRRHVDKLIGLIGTMASHGRQVVRQTEFGAVVRVQEAEGAIVTDIAVDDARADAPLLVPSVEHHQKLFGHVPGTVATDRGFYSGRGERLLGERGVKHPVLPKAGHRTQDRIAYERQRYPNLLPATTGAGDYPSTKTIARILH